MSIITKHFQENFNKNILDMIDPGDSSYSPMFDCKKCGGLMRPVYFVGYSGIEYTYDGN